MLGVPLHAVHKIFFGICFVSWLGTKIPILTYKMYSDKAVLLILLLFVEGSEVQLSISEDEIESLQVMF